MMKKTILLVLCLTLCLTLCACAQEGDTPSDGEQAISFVLGATEVFPKINYAVCYDRIYSSMFSFSEVSAFVADGNVQLALHSSARRPDHLNAAKHQQLANQYTQEVMSCLSSLSADDPETDVLSAIQMAAATLHGSDSEQKTLYIISSGLSTAGMLDFSSSSLLDADPAWITEELSKASSVPDLSEIDVIWQGLGQTAGHQQPLDSNARAKLTDIWTAILEAGHPACLTIDPTPLADITPADGLPACSDVSYVTATLSAPKPDREEVMTADTVLRVDESSVAFLPDQAELADPEAASEVLQAIAQTLRETEVPIVLAGSTASVGGDGIALSEARAEAIKEVLVSFGVPQEQITCVGLGRSPWSLRANDLDENGTLIEEQARLNRAVFVFAADSDAARELGL